MEVAILHQLVLDCLNKVERGTEVGDWHVGASCAVCREQCRAIKIICQTRWCAGRGLRDRDRDRHGSSSSYSSSSRRGAMHHIEKFFPEAEVDDGRYRCCRYGILGLGVHATLEDRADFGSGGVK